MLTLAGCDLPNVLFQGPDLLICGGTRTVDAVRVRVRLLRARDPTAQQRAAWRASVAQLQAMAGAWGEHVVEVRPVGDVEAVILLDDGRRPVSTLVTPDATWPVASALRVGVAVLERLAHRPPDGTLPAIHADSVWLSKADEAVALVPTGDDPRYWAPERFAGRGGDDERIAFYALGVLLFHMLTGQRPFDSATAEELAHAHAARRPPDLRALRPEVPAIVATLVSRLLAKDRARRYQSRQGLLADLRAVANALEDGRATDDIALGVMDDAAQFRLPDRIYGRNHEIELLRSALDRARWGWTPPVLLSGEPGIGKSALPAALRADVGRDGGRFISGKFDQYKRTVPYSAVVEAFSDLVQQVLNEPDAEVAAWRERLAHALGANARVLADIVPALHWLLDELPAAPPFGPTETRNRFNSTLRQFVRLFATSERPLVLVLDDLQWGDGASLSLFATLAGDATLSHLLLIGAYRDSEAGPSGLLSGMLDELRGIGADFTAITVGPIADSDTLAFVADTVRQLPAACQPLATLVHERAGGNPFFTRQFLRALVDDGLMVFDPGAGAWCWDLAGARIRAFSESVTDLMSERLSRQPQETRTALRIASCVGTAFTPRILAAVLGRPETELTAALQVALDEGLVSAPVPGVDDRWRFVHDRIQQAAYAFISLDERASLRGHIGRVMREQLNPDELDDALFEVVANLADGGTREMPPAAARDFGTLSLMAGDRARTALAYEDAHTFLRSGLSAIEGLPECGELEFRTRAALFECAYLTARFDEAKLLLDQLLRDAPDVSARVRILNTKIVIDTAQGRSIEAVRLGIDTARSLGMGIPEHPSLLSVLVGLIRVQLALRWRRPAKLRSLPSLTDPERVAAIGVLLRIGPAAYFNNPGAFLLSNLAIVRISLRHGHGAGSSFGYIIYAMVLGARLGNAALGHEFGQLAIELSDRLDPPDIRPKIHLIYGAFVACWKRPYQEGIRVLADAFLSATEAGDLQYASYCQQSTIFLRVAFGAPVDDVLAQADRFLAFAVQVKDEFPIETQTTTRQRVRALCGQTVALDRLDDEGFDEAEWVARVKAGGNLTTQGYYQTAKVSLAWLAGDIPTALDYGLLGFRNLDALLSQIHTAEICLYYGLALATAQREPLLASRVNRKHLAACRKTLARHAADCPENFECWHLLLEASASTEREEGRLSQYDRAIASAKRHKQFHIAAMAAEAAARSQAAQGRRTVAEVYLEEALAGYDHWRATAKSAALVSEFADLLPDRAISQVAASGPMQRPPTQGAIESAMLAVRELSIEPNVDRLLERLLGLALSSTGADRGQVLLRETSGLVTAAEADAEHGSRALSVRVPLAQATSVCAPLVQASTRRRAPIVLADAISDPQFGETPYVSRSRPRAIACVPITIGNEVEGALYLENTQTPGVFTPERQRLLGIMADQVAVAVERMGLANAARESREALSTAMRRVDVLEKAKAHLGKFVPASVQRIIDANPDAPALEKRERDVTILFLDIEGYSALTESLPRERLDWLVRTYFSRFLDVVHAHRGEVNETAGDGLMILFQDDDPAVHAVNACRAGVAIGRGCRALNEEFAGKIPPVTVNVGINSGASLVGSTRLQGGGDARWTFTATGTVTNIAARLGAYATSGAIVISEATACRVGREFALDPLGAHALKNLRDPVVLFRLRDQGAEQ